MIEEEEPENPNDGLDCFNFSLLLDDINSSSQKKKNPFLSPEKNEFRKASHCDNRIFIDEKEVVTRNLDGDFTRTFRGAEELSFPQATPVPDRAAQKSKNRTPETNYTTNSTTTGKKRKQGKDFNIWGAFKFTKFGSGVKQAVDRSELDQGKESVSGNCDFKEEYRFGVNSDALSSTCAQRPGQHKDLFSDLEDSNFNNYRKASQQIVSSGMKFDDLFSVSSVDTREESTKQPSSKQANSTAKKTLFASSQSFVPFPLVNRTPKKNSLNVVRPCDLQSLSSKLRKGSFNEKEYRTSRQRGYSYQQSNTVQAGGENSINLEGYVKSDAENAVRFLLEVLQNA